jgi:hypothetical protein
MSKTKMEWIDINCNITLPEEIEENFNKLLSIYKKQSRSKKKLKKKFNRITTNNLLNKNLLEYKNTNIYDNEKEIFIDLTELSITSTKIPKQLENRIIDYIDLIIKKYMKIYIHFEDQTYLIPEKNINNDKIFLKFYFPKVNNNDDNILIENKINTFGDNIHFTLLPEIFGHGKDGMFHLTFRIESKKGIPIYEYSKYISFNIIDDKFGIILYDDEKGNNSIVFKLSNNIEELNNFIQNIINFSNNLEETINTSIFKDICLYIALDIFKKLFASKKINNFFTRYLNSYGLETVSKMINKLLSILLSTFINLYNS